MELPESAGMFAVNNSLALNQNSYLNGIQGEFLPFNQMAGMKNIAFIDRTIQNYENLVAGINPHTEIVILDPTRDGVEQITEILALRTEISSAHIITHGNEASLQLGTTQLTLTNLDQYRASLEQWKNALTINADIILYGCNVAAGEQGTAFVQSLSEITDADIAASDDLTGSAALGGDWAFEVKTGEIEAKLALEAETMAGYDSVLLSFTTTNFGAGVGVQPQSVAANDFNGDGHLDLAVPTRASGVVSVLLGDSTGKFGTATNFKAGQYPFDVAVGNFNADSFPDIAVANWGTSNVSILLGDGKGSFQAATNFSVGSSPWSVDAGDFNGDGKLDLATANIDSNDVSILLGDGTGSFKAATNFSVGLQPQSVVVGDFNADSKLDLATANFNSNNVSVLLGTGTGSFGTATNFNVGSNPYALAVGDLNADGKADLAVANQGSNSVSILLGTGTGSFGGATNFSVGSGPRSVAVGDINGDGKLDLATANLSADSVSILLGTGTGSFNPATNFSTGAGTGPWTVTISDLNKDGALDLATSNYWTNNVSVLLNTTPLVNFGAATYKATEENSDAIVNIPVTLSATPGTDVIVPIVINNGSTATEGVSNDFILSTKSITFKAGATGNELTQNIAVTIKPDNIPENDETVILDFGAITAAAAGVTKQTTLTIGANDAVDYSISTSDATIMEGNSGSTAITFTVTRSGGIGTASSVNYSIGGGATNNSDYKNIGGTSGATGTTGTINFAAGETQKTITMDVLGDTFVELNEAIAVTLSNPTAPGPVPTITSAIATTIINNDDSVNSAPILDNSGNPTLKSINQNDVVDNNTGTLISAIIGNSVTDLDIGAVKGIAVTQLDNSNGTWQFSTNNGSSWTNFGSVSDSSATVLTATANDKIRFLPATNFSGSSTITFRAWDTTDGSSNGATGVNSSINGGTTAFSSTSETASITVTPLSAPEIELRNAGINIADETVTPIDFGITTPGKSITKTFTIRNTGNAALNVSELKLPSGFSLVGTFPQTVQPASSSTFDVKLDATGIGNSSGTLSFTTNDSDENPFNFPIKGAVKDHVCDLQQVWQGLETTLDRFQEIVESKMQGIKFPILGPLKKLDPNFINSFKDSLVNEIDNVPDLTEDLLIKGISKGLSPYFPNLEIINYGTSDQVAYQIKFGKEYRLPNVSLSQNLGIPALGLTLDGQGESTFRYDFSLAFGVHKDFCFFIDTDKTNLSASIDFGLNNNFQAKGNMGFLQLDLKNDVNNPTKIGADFEIKLKDLDNIGGPDDGDRLTLAELKGNYRFNDLYDFTLNSNANLGLNARTSINGNAAIPSFGFDLALNWPLFKYESGELTWPQKPTVSFNNTKLYLGTFISNFAKPVLGKVNNIIDPFRPVIKLLNTDTKLLSKLGLGSVFDRNGDSKITLLEVAATLSGSKIDSGFFDAINSIDKVTQLLNKISPNNGEIAIDLGSYSLGDFDVSNSSSSIQKATINTKSVAQDFKSQIQFQKPVDSTTKEFLVGFTDMGGVDFPILKKPQTIIQLLMGKPDVTLFTYKVPKLSVDFNIRKTFPIWGPISGLLEGNFNAQTHIAFGFDSYGLQQWKNAGFSSSSADKVLDGFYISDRENPDGTGADVDELSLAARIAVGAGINVGVAYGYLKGGIQGNVGIDLIDIGEFTPKVGGDGKIRASEITSRISQPANLFDINGTVNAFLGAEVKVGFKIFGKKIQKTIYNNNFATFELAKFNLGPSSTSRGKVSNKYIAEATVFFDANFNGVQDSNEPLTISNADGSFDLDISLDDFDSNKNGKIDVTEGRIVAKDGIDTYTYLPQETPLMATPDSSMVTPLTTLISKLVEQGINPDEAQTKVKAALGLPLTIDLNNYDPLEAINQNDPNGFRVLADHVQVQNTIGQITNLISGASTASGEKISESAIAAISEQINTGVTLNLSDSAQLQNLIESAATKVKAQDPSFNLQQLFSLAPVAASVIAEQNQRIEKVTSSSSKEIFIDQIVAIQKIALGETTKDLKDTASGIKPINELLAENTGIVLDAQIEEFTVESASSLPDFNSNKMFDSGFYLAKNLDVAEAVAKKVFPNAWTHFNQFGYAEGRNPSAIFATNYLNENPDVAEAVAKGFFHSGFEHFVKHGLTEGREPAADFSSLETFYLSQNSDVAEAVRRGNLGSGIEHLVRFGMAEGRNPFTPFNVLSATFDPTFYLAGNQDVAEAVNRGFFRSAFEHFVWFGLFENRNPNILFDHASYLAQNSDVAVAVKEGFFRSGLEHFIKHGMAEGRSVTRILS